MENILAGLNVLASLKMMILLFAGLVLGFIVGALPGFSSSNAAAVLLPISIGFGLEEALVFMAALYTGAQFGGSVPAILINTPGTAGAAATALDGYPMARKGQAALAIGIARMGSVLGGLIGGLITLALLFPMSKFGLKFGTAELFLVALFGLTLISSLVGDAVRKGLISAGLGLLIAAMSADPVLGVGRFTMGFIELYDKVPFVPILIGLFALSEMVALSRKIGKSKETSGNALNKESFKDIIDGIKTTIRYPIDVLRASIIGLIVGIIPGTGTAVSNFISYGIAKKTAKNPENFGKGDPRGIIASESCDSAVTGGTMIPTLTLGIPGSTTAAIMLAAFYLHGVIPGPQVMVNHAPMAYAVVLSIIVSSILILPVGILLAQPMVKISYLSPRILVPVVSFLCIIGAFAVSNSMFDAKLAFVFGLVGILMNLNIKLAPLRS